MESNSTSVVIVIKDFSNFVTQQIEQYGTTSSVLQTKTNSNWGACYAQQTKGDCNCKDAAGINSVS